MLEETDVGDILDSIAPYSCLSCLLEATIETVVATDSAIDAELAILWLLVTAEETTDPDLLLESTASAITFDFLGRLGARGFFWFRLSI